MLFYINNSYYINLFICQTSRKDLIMIGESLKRRHSSLYFHTKSPPRKIRLLSVETSNSRLKQDHRHPTFVEDSHPETGNQGECTLLLDHPHSIPTIRVSSADTIKGPLENSTTKRKRTCTSDCVIDTISNYNLEKHTKRQRIDNGTLVTHRNIADSSTNTRVSTKPFCTG